MTSKIFKIVFLSKTAPTELKKLTKFEVISLFQNIKKSYVPFPGGPITLFPPLNNIM